MASLRLSFLGSPQVQRGEKALHFDTRKAVALLAYLALHAHPQSREKLVSIFWPEYPPERAFANLRRTLWSLRKKVGKAWFDIGRQTLALKPQPGLWIDIREFLSHIHVCECHDHTQSIVCSTCVSSAVAAIELYKDDFLRGFTLADSAPFDDWQFFQTDMLREKQSNLLKRVVTYYSTQMQLEQAIFYAKQWLALCPLEEETHRELIRVYILNSQRSAAYQQYQECVRMLDEEFGMPPDKTTTELFHAIVSQESAPQRPHISEENTEEMTPSPAYQATPFIGRQREVEEITRLLRRSDCRLLTLPGLGGIGKTRLAQKIVPDVVAYYPDGVYFIPLAEVSHARLVLPALADHLRFSASSQGDYQYTFLRYLAGKKLLLILDNIEHLPDAKELLVENSQTRC